MIFGVLLSRSGYSYMKVVYKYHLGFKNVGLRQRPVLKMGPFRIMLLTDKTGDFLTEITKNYSFLKRGMGCLEQLRSET